MTNITPSGGVDVGDGIELSWPPLDRQGNAITGEAANITLTIKEPGKTAVEKTGAELSEDAGTYSYMHKPTVAGVTYGKWVYNGAGNADGVEQFWFRVRGVTV